MAENFFVGHPASAEQGPNAVAARNDGAHQVLLSLFGLRAVFFHPNETLARGDE
jgi:hypothetical protein